jgi:hypothetical protein
VRDSTGTARATFTTAEELTAAGIVTNPCGHDISFTTMDTCLVSGGDMMGTGFWAWPAVCGEAITEWVVPAGSAVAQTQWASTKPAGTWTLNLRFNYGGATASTSFTVTADED